MSAAQMLEEMLDLLRAQVAAVILGDHEALLAGAARHEQMLSELRRAEVDLPTEQLRELHEQIEFEKAKLQSLLSTEAARVDFLLRILTGAAPSKGVGYPGKVRQEANSRMVDRRA